MTTIAYVDCFSGASGDMLLGALLDAGLSFGALQEDVAALGLGTVRLTVAYQVRRGIAGSKLDVMDETHERPARNLASVRAILEASPLPASVTERSLAVFTALAEAEAQVHGVSVDEVHFHEVGAVDTLVDIIGVCAGLERLGIEELYASPLPLGSGTIQTEHGLLPVPAPATLALLAQAQAPVAPFDARSELVTPTGAALLATLATFAQPPMRVRRVGYGFGTKEFPWPNLLRIWIGEALPQAAHPPAAHQHEHEHEHGHDHEHPRVHS